jgi:BRCT domain type II-containing protein
MTGPAKPRDTRPSVCFTGFSGPEEEPVRKLADEKGLRIATSVLKDLAYLVTGISPGPKKIEKAKKQGCKILTEVEFRREMEGFQSPAVANDEAVFELKVEPTPERKG